jgi:hypothetical protein
MPYQEKSGQYNQLQWFLTSDEKTWLDNNKSLPNKALFAAFNAQFNCEMTYSRMRHFVAQYNLKKMDRGEAYTGAEKAYVQANYEKMSDKHMGIALNRTEKSILKLRYTVLKLRRSEASTKILRRFRSQSGARSYHDKIARGELQHPSVVLADSFIIGRIKRGNNLQKVDLPNALIQLEKARLTTKRELKKWFGQQKK